MLAPRSYTREDVIELQCHGSEVCLGRVLKACLDAGARLAEPGGNFKCPYKIYFLFCGISSFFFFPLSFLVTLCDQIIIYFILL